MKSLTKKPKNWCNYVCIFQKVWKILLLQSSEYFFFLLGDQQHTETSTPGTLTMTTSLTPTVESQFQCQFYQIPIQFKCDSIIHCVPDGADEQDCPKAPALSSTTSIPSIKAPKNHNELRVEFQKDKKIAWKSKNDVKKNCN